jgi:hypothetical protein
MKNNLITRAWQHNIGCPIKIVLVPLLMIQRGVDANAHAGMRKGMGDLSSSNTKVALKKNREKQAHYCKNMSAGKRAGEQKRLDSIRTNETEAQYKD